MKRADSAKVAAAVGAAMEIHHKLRPPHGWREFLFEIGTIVLGVLLALGAEQTVEAMHRAHQVEEAESAMRSELLTDDGLQAYTRAAISGCFATQLAAMRYALEAGADRKTFYDMANSYGPPVRSWDDQAWTSAKASNVAALMGAKRLNAWSSAYNAIPPMDRVAMNEINDLVALKTGRRSPGKLSDAETDRFLLTVDRLANENLGLGILSLGVLNGMGKAGIELAPATRRALLTEAHNRFGPCVKEPDVGIWRSLGQTSDPNAVRLP
ncbi:MAG TPA: hypothetical protein VG407_18590 [Caulobacteraceae bacterium]|nr:hypothetical protein [Caulobacteraceae bacterium]